MGLVWGLISAVVRSELGLKWQALIRNLVAFVHFFHLFVVGLHLLHGKALAPLGSFAIISLRLL